jgi:bla regulator protein BlaR1
MIPKTFADIWTALAPSLGNHVWQSSLFACIIALLSVALRNNRAQLRYGLWLVASAKFLIPFSLLATVGSYLGSSRARVSAAAETSLYFAMEQVSQPFTQQTAAALPHATPQTAFQSLSHLFPALLLVWLCGFGVVLFVWWVRWRRISAVVREAERLLEGREVETLRRLETTAGMPKQVEILSSRTSLEPGIFGITRPILLWPVGITGRLEDAHLKAILAHELLHIRRRDNLAAALHMLVEAVFWFHPLVWWMGTRLVEERERACDEEVVESGSDPQVYAESILKICEFCVGSPLTCVSGVTGAELKSRITRIMSDQITRKLDMPRKLLLGVAGFLAVSTPILYGLLNSTQSRAASVSPSRIGAAEGKRAFETASVSENTTGSETSSMNVPLGPGDIYAPTGGVFSASNVPLISYIYFAYDLSGAQFQLLLPHLPNWVIRDRFDIHARTSGNPTKNQMRLMVQTLLANRFKLQAHYETQQLPVLALVLDRPGKTGPQLLAHPSDASCPDTSSGSKPASTLPNGLPADCGGIVGLPSNASGRLRVGARNVPMGLLAATLPQVGNLDRAVLDKTGLNGTLDFTFEWTPQHTALAPTRENLPERLSEPGSTFVEDLKEQLGLKLEPQNGPVEVFILDHAEKPAEVRTQNTTPALPALTSVSITPNRLGSDRLPLIMFGPDGFSFKNASLQEVIRLAYGVEDDRIIGAPAWLASDKYDVEAKENSSDADDPRKLSVDRRVSEQGRMLQEVLADRLKLVLHRETRDLGVLSLALAKGGPKLQESKPGDTYPNGFKGPDGVARPGGMHFAGNNTLIAQGVPIATLQVHLSSQLRRTILDETGLSGTYDFTLQLPDSIPLGIDNPAPPQSYEPALSTTIEQQLGLKLEPRKASMEVLVIEHVERPAEN